MTVLTFQVHRPVSLTAAAMQQSRSWWALSPEGCCWLVLVVSCGEGRRRERV